MRKKILIGVVTVVGVLGAIVGLSLFDEYRTKNKWCSVNRGDDDDYFEYEDEEIAGEFK